MKIITNYHERPIFNGFELNPKEREEFDYLDDIESEYFFRYRGIIYDLNEFTRWDNPASPTRTGYWQGYRADSFFSAVVIRLSEDYESVVCGLCLT